MRMKLLKLKLKQKIAEYEIMALGSVECAEAFKSEIAGLQIALEIARNIPKKEKPDW